MLYFIIILVISVFIIIFCNNSFSTLPALGKFLSPQHGVWQNSEFVKMPSGKKLIINNNKLEGVKVLYDKRNVPHIIANTDYEAYFMQGYLHARDRLWQMDFYTYLASGRLSEIIGINGLEIDKFIRKTGMPILAKNMTKLIESDIVTKNICDSYTEGVNEYIKSLKYSKYPLEYKLYSYTPELWSNYKTALLIKLIAFDKTGFNEDFKKTIIAKNFGSKMYNLLYPIISTIDVPTFFSTADFDVPEKTIKPINISLLKINDYFLNDNMPNDFKEPYTPSMEINSSTWAIAPNKSISGNSILCNSFGSFLTLPNSAYELQIKTKYQNVYGISYPGIPCVFVGFNEKCAWGLNIPNIDVKDYYEIEFNDDTKSQFLFNGEWKNVESIKETIKIKNAIDIKEINLSTFLGPIVFTTKSNNKNKGYVIKWTLYEKSNELKSFYLLNKMKNYEEFKNAINNIVSPVYNITYTDKLGNIGVNLEGKIPARDNYQGDFVMPAVDSTYLWKYYIPYIEKPFLYNPSSKFVFSSNQMLFYPEIYPYYLGNRFNSLSSKRIYDFINNKEKVSVKEMQNLQNENFSPFAEVITPLLLEYINLETLDSRSLKYIKTLQNWNFRYDAEEEGPTILELWVNRISKNLKEKKFNQINELNNYEISPMALLQMLQNTDVENPLLVRQNKEIEKWDKIVVNSFKEIMTQLIKLNKDKKLEWSFNYNRSLLHPLNLKSASIKNINVLYGNDKLLNNFNTNYGQNCKLIVHLSTPIEAYISIAGGQSGNAGSKFYTSSIENWLNGDYDKIYFYTQKETNIQDVETTETVTNKKEKSIFRLFNLE